MHSKTPIHPLKITPRRPNYIALDVGPHQPVSKILRFAPRKNPYQTLIDKPRTLHQLNLNFDGNPLQPAAFLKLVANLKQLKSLHSLNFDLNWLPFERRSIYKFFKAIKHLKNLSVIHISLRGSETNFFERKIQPLCQAIKKIRQSLKVEIKLSLSPMNLISYFHGPRLLESLKKSPRFTCAHLNFSNRENFADARTFITPLKKCKSLSNLHLYFYACKIVEKTDFSDFLEDLKDLQSVKNSKVYLKKCGGLTNSNLKSFVPAFKEAARIMSLEIIFEECSEITIGSEWRSFAKSLGSQKVRAKMIGRKMKKARQPMKKFKKLILVGLLLVALIAPWFIWLAVAS